MCSHMAWILSGEAHVLQRIRIDSLSFHALKWANIKALASPTIDYYSIFDYLIIILALYP